MPEKELLNELAKTLESELHKKYVEAYIGDKKDGLSKKFDELVGEDLSET